jgi:FAD/FMN-containing dehydrogenase/Fe-S oxidoreductase
MPEAASAPASTSTPSPARAAAPSSDPEQPPSLESALRSALSGEVEFGSGTCAVYATDSSNYRQVPIGVVFPRDEADVISTLTICAEFDVPVLGRGGGTSLAGQGCNEAVVVDFSRHMNAVLELDPVARTARVQPGLVLDDLRRAAEAHGLTFGPDPATHAWCTLGGMIGNNSCGTHALFAGKTVDNVERLRVVTYGGARYEFGSYDDEQYSRLVTADAPEAAVLGSLREIGRRAADLVKTQFPDINRRVSGFNLDQILPDRPAHVARLLVGTESTCVLVTEALVRLIPSPTHRRLVILGYPSVFEAADAVPDLLGILPQGLLGLEGFDVTLARQMKAHHLNTAQLGLLPDLEHSLERGSGGWLLAELGGDTPDEADARTERFVAALPAATVHRRLDDPVEQRGAWAIRESGLGATALRADGAHNVEGWEDAAVPPAKLGTYLRALTQLWSEFGYEGAWYGHFGQGCVHTRNNFDLHTEAGLRTYRAYVERAADLVASLGGSLSGEHGDGQSRGELLERMYGPELVDAFRQVKAVFDPRGRMNPGKVVDPYPLDTNLRFGPAYRTSTLTPTYFPFADDAGSFQHAAERCVGVGRCRRDDTDVMCPSYRATRDERHSTRGRAKLLVELFQGEVTPETWRNEDVREALDLCLACKGCAVDCPTHVDMATYKAEFLAQHYRGRLRPREMYALGFVPWLARLATRVPTLANAALTAPGISPLFKRAAGVTTLRPAPRFAARSVRRLARARARTQAAASPASPSASVVLWPDTFTDAYRPALAQAWQSVLEAAGETVAVPTDWACCARPLYDSGMLDLARRTLRHLLDVLEVYIADGIPIVVPEPSCLAAFRDELPQLLADDPRAAKLAALSRSPAEHLLAIDAAKTLPRPVEPRRVLIHPHCHARAIHASDADRRLLEDLGHEVSVLDAGCCGLAGSFGFSAAHEAMSRTIGTEQWLPKLRAAASPDTELVIDGFSCATQYAHLAPSGSPVATTLPELLLAAAPLLRT